MRAERGRKKKLIVAFHFQRSNRAAWKCDECRRQGLEIRRRCGFLPAAAETAPTVVWARARVSTNRCPTSEITAESWGLLESYWVWRRLGACYPEEMPARQVEALLILDREARMEESDGGR